MNKTEWHKNISDYVSFLTPKNKFSVFRFILVCFFTGLVIFIVVMLNIGYISGVSGSIDTSYVSSDAMRVLTTPWELIKAIGIALGISGAVNGLILIILILTKKLTR